MTETSTAADMQVEERLVQTWARATEEAFEKLTRTKPKLNFVCDPQASGKSELLASLEWWEAQYEAAGGHMIWIGISAPGALEIGRLGEVLASAGSAKPEPQSLPARETVEALCQSFARILSSETGRTVSHQGLTRLEQPPSPDVIYSTEVTLPAGTTAPLLVGLKSATQTALHSLIQPAGRNARPASANGPLGLLLDLELPLAVRFGTVQMPLERVLELRPGSMLELEGSQQEQVDLLVNGSVVARGEVVAVEGQYGVRILEVLSRDYKLAMPRM